MKMRKVKGYLTSINHRDRKIWFATKEEIEGRGLYPHMGKGYKVTEEWSKKDFDLMGEIWKTLSGYFDEKGRFHEIRPHFVMDMEQLRAVITLKGNKIQQLEWKERVIFPTKAKTFRELVNKIKIRKRKGRC